MNEGCKTFRWSLTPWRKYCFFIQPSNFSSQTRLRDNNGTWDSRVSLWYSLKKWSCCIVSILMNEMEIYWRHGEFVLKHIANMLFILFNLKFWPKKVNLKIRFSNRDMDGRLFAINYVILPCPWTSQFSFKGATNPNLVRWERRG